MNKILVDIADAMEQVREAEEAHKLAINSCMPVVLQEYIDKQIADIKTEKDYENASDDDKAKMNEMFEKVVEQKTKKMAELKDAADYDEMDDANRAMFDKLLLA